MTKLRIEDDRFCDCYFREYGHDPQDYVDDDDNYLHRDFKCDGEHEVDCDVCDEICDEVFICDSKGCNILMCESCVTSCKGCKFDACESHSDVTKCFNCGNTYCDDCVPSKSTYCEDCDSLYCDKCTKEMIRHLDLYDFSCENCTDYFSNEENNVKQWKFPFPSSDDVNYEDLLKTYADMLISAKQQIVALQQSEKLVKSKILKIMEKYNIPMCSVEGGHIKIMKMGGYKTYKRDTVMNYIARNYGNKISNDVDRACVNITKKISTVAVHLKTSGKD